MIRNVRLDVLWIRYRLFDSIFYRNNVCAWHRVGLYCHTATCLSLNTTTDHSNHHPSSLETRDGRVPFFANHHHRSLSAPSSELRDRHLPTHHHHDMSKTSNITGVVAQGRTWDARWKRGRIYQGRCTRYAHKSLFLIYLLTKTPRSLSFNANLMQQGDTPFVMLIFDAARLLVASNCWISMQREGFPLLFVLNGRNSMWQGVEPLVASLHWFSTRR